ncbi:unnamed protein product [Mytilus edulis]|uniref:Uncharacterized protein n=1 Tax=Mytilus edulis TaxID=6550 RepID=A0A8S3S7L5_MYTED|nr:unnamed protein product [Mytilus edulis]
MNLSISDRRKMAGNFNTFDEDSISKWSNSQMNRFLEDMPGFGEEERGVESSPIHFGTTFQPKVSTGKGFYEHRMFDDESSSSSALKEGKNKKRGREEEEEDEEEKENRKKMKKCDEHVKSHELGEISSQIDNLNKIKQEMVQSNGRILELIEGTITQLRKEKPRRVLFSSIL